MEQPQHPAPHRRPDGTFAPGHPGKPKGAISKHKRKLRELVEAEVGTDPLPVRMARIGARAEEQGDDALALTAYAAAAQYCYGKVKPQEAKDDNEHGLVPGTSYKVVGVNEDPTPDHPGQRVLIDPTRSTDEGVIDDRAFVTGTGELTRLTIQGPTKEH